MTNHWNDIQHADSILIMGSNPAENHPISFKWVNEARSKRKARLIVVDPRFTRSAATADIYARIRPGSDIAFLGAMINYAIEKNRIHEEYVKNYTDASYLVSPDFQGPVDLDGAFSGLTGAKYDKATWGYQMDENGIPKMDLTLTDPMCVFQLLKKHYSRYTLKKSSELTGCDIASMEAVFDAYTATFKPELSGTIMYAMGTTQHTSGSQNVRAYAVLQLLLGNIGVAGGGINALRGESNVQGSTDHGALFNILTGYLKYPKANQPTLVKYNEENTPKTKDPKSLNWWGNTPKYMASLMKAWWRDADLETSYSYLPKIDDGKNYSYLPIFSTMANGDIKGLFCWGMNPAVGAPSSKMIRRALAQLDWLVCVDLWETETAAFWQKEAGVNPADIKTEVFLLPAASSVEKEGSISNSGRWVQWRYKAIEPVGHAEDDLWIINQIVGRMKNLYKKEGGAFPDPILNLTWNYGKVGLDGMIHNPSPREVAKEINGYFIAEKEIEDKVKKEIKKFKPGDMVPSFAMLQDDGSTCCGCWVYCGSVSDTENKLMKRDATDPTGLGMFPNWSWSWPVNRRIVYNRASVNIEGKPFSKEKPVIWWSGLKKVWLGDIPDGNGDPDVILPFIMVPHGRGMLFAAGMADGPFPEHYEPLESAVKNTFSSQQVSPVITRWDQKAKEKTCNPIIAEGCVAAIYGSEDIKDFPIICSTYRVTEHWQTGQMTRWLSWLGEMVPHQFVEMSEEFAKEKGITFGDKVRVTSARNVEGIVAYVMITKRLKPFVIAGKTHHMVGITWHFGYKGLVTGAIANDLTPFIGDPNTMIPEYKAFLVNVVKA
jgi:formate dehydrogenase-N alpha subunit